MRLPTGGELLVDCLRTHGVRHVFSIIGGQMGSIYDAIGLAPDIDVVTPRNETAAALMACGYTATSGRPCVSMATVGAGVVYEVAGLSKAWFDYLPVVSIAPQVQSYRVKPHQESLQACNQDEIFYPVTKWNSIVFHWKRIPQMVDRAFREALTGIPGPTHLDIPVDVLFKRAPLTGKRRRRMMVPPARSRYGGPIRPGADRLAEAARALSTAGNPLVIVGQGIGRPGRHPETGELLEAIGAPVLTTLGSAGIMPVASECYAGDLSLVSASPGASELLAGADLVLLVGMDPDSREYLSGLASPPPVVQVESDQRAFATWLEGLVPLRADAATALGELSAGRGSDPGEWRDRVVNAGREAARNAAAADGRVNRAVAALSEASGRDDIIVADGPGGALAGKCLLNNAACRGLYIMDGRHIRGAGLPFSLGAAIGSPEASVVLVTDKDSLFRHVRELQPAACENIGVSLLVIDDAGPSNVADTGSVLEGLGCRVLSPAGANGFLSRKSVPEAVLIR